MPKERYYQILDEVRGTVLYSLDDLVGGESPDEAVRISELVVHDDLPIDHNLIQAESLAELTAAIEQLSDRERLVLSLYYKDDLTFKGDWTCLGRYRIPGCLRSIPRPFST